MSNWADQIKAYTGVDPLKPRSIHLDSGDIMTYGGRVGNTIWRRKMPLPNPFDPDKSVTVTFGKYKYHYWNEGDTWYWVALGNSGTAKTAEEARAAARRWIQHGQ